MSQIQFQSYHVGRPPERFLHVEDTNGSAAQSVSRKALFSISVAVRGADSVEVLFAVRGADSVADSVGFRLRRSRAVVRPLRVCFV